jgi:hypothetical protein
LFWEEAENASCDLLPRTPERIPLPESGWPSGRIYTTHKQPAANQTGGAKGRKHSFGFIIFDRLPDFTIHFSPSPLVLESSGCSKGNQ